MIHFVGALTKPLTLEFLQAVQEAGRWRGGRGPRYHSHRISALVRWEMGVVVAWKMFEPQVEYDSSPTLCKESSRLPSRQPLH